MGKHFWRKHISDESQEWQPGCMRGLVHVLNYHRFLKDGQCQERKVPRHGKCDLSSEANLYGLDGFGSQHLHTKESGARKKPSLRSRIKALTGEEIAKDDEDVVDKEFLYFKTKLQGTFSLHDLEAMDVGWGGSLIWLTKNVENHVTVDMPESRTTSKEEVSGDNPLDAAEPKYPEKPDILEIFGVDRGLLVKNLRDADETMAKFSRTALGLNTKSKLSRSRSFPPIELAKGKKLKPKKLESKHKEMWSLRKSQNTKDEIGEKRWENGCRKSTLQRGSLKDTLGNAQLRDNSLRMDASTLKGLTLSNDYDCVPERFRRAQSLSNYGLYEYNPYFVEENKLVLPQNDGENVTLNAYVDRNQKNLVGGCNSMNVREGNSRLQVNRNAESENEECLNEEAEKLKNSESCSDQETNSSNTTQDEILDQEFSFNSDICLQEANSSALELPTAEDQNSLKSKFPSTCSSLHLENNEIFEKMHTKNNDSDMHYIRHLLDQSGIAVDPCGITWHTSHQPLSPKLFEKVEACWPHENDQLNGWPHFYGCWHHRMLFDLVNETILELYDAPLLCFPRALSSSCHNNRIIKEVCASIGTLLNAKLEVMLQSIDCIVAGDMAHNRSWMNLHQETEYLKMELADMIFNELLEEAVQLQAG